MKIDQETLNLIALEISREAHEENFPARRGHYQYCYNGTEMLALFSNNPWSGSANERRELLAWLEAKGISVLARGEYGEPLPDGTLYTQSWLLDSPEREMEIVSAWRAILGRLYGKAA